MRLIVAGTHSGCGKTTVTLALMAALRARGLVVAPFKVGPDYIDPGFHRLACGRPSDNLDSFLMAPDAVRGLVAEGEGAADIALIEGVMGYYDGLRSEDFRCSTWELARITRTGALMVVDASGGAASAAAVVKGFRSLRRDSRIAGVIINRAASRAHYDLVRAAVERYAGAPCVGWLPKDAALTLKSRHLGLVPAEETAEAARLIGRAAETIRETADLDRILRLAENAPPLQASKRRPPDMRAFRLGVAWDAAFSFYYEENLQMLRESGMALTFFSPLADERPPEGLDGLYFGGGFPEVFADRLSENRAMLESIRDLLEGGMKCYAECGGMMYLSRAIDGRAMVGFLPVTCRMTGRLQRFGYVRVTDRTGLTFPAHEFHHAVAEPEAEISTAFRVTKASDPVQAWDGGYERKNTLAGFPHLHFRSHPALIERLWK